MSTTIEKIETGPEFANRFAPESFGVFDSAIRIRLGSTAEEMLASFDQFILQNPDLILEQDSSGEIVIMAPAGAEGSSANNEIARQLGNWTMNAGGRVFDSSALFVLPRGSKRSPDAAWIQTDRWEALPKEERMAFPHIAPDFVMELRSPTDRLATLKIKMQEYIDNGVRLAWLIDPILKQVHIYQPGKPIELLDNPTSVSGGEVLAGFTLELVRIF